MNECTKPAIGQRRSRHDGRRRLARWASLLAFCVVPLAGAEWLNAEPDRATPVAIEYFFEPGCGECSRVSDEVLPLLRERYAGLFTLTQWDIGVESNYLGLVTHMERLGVDENAHVFMVVDGQEMLAGFDAIEERLWLAIESRLATREHPTSATDPTPQPGAPHDVTVLATRVEGFVIGGVLLAGLTDGVNPCAISTLVFLISVLTMARVSGTRLLLIGGAFCAASFVTYTAIGFGLLRALYLLSSFPLIRRSFELVLVAVLGWLAIYSFLDAVRYRRSGRAEDVTLQLPARIKGWIHRLLRRGLGPGVQVLSAVVIGAAVTGLESVCTGQVYLPTLAAVARTGSAVGARALVYLLLYNLMFILPLVVVLILTHRGLQVMRLIEWSRRHVLPAKVLLGAFFLALAVVMLLLF